MFQDLMVAQVGPSLDFIVELFHERKSLLGADIARMSVLRDQYNGDVIVPLPEMDRAEESAVANIIATGLNQTAMRIASTLPNIYYPPLDNSNNASINRARTRTLANKGWWTANDMSGKLRLRSRKLIGYASSPVSLRPNIKTGAPLWQLRDPLSCFPSTPDDATDMTPENCIFSYQRTRGWVKVNYPEQLTYLSARLLPRNQWDAQGTRAIESPEDKFTVLEYQDPECTVLLILAMDSGLPNKQGLPFVQLERTVNRTGMTLVVTPGRFTLDRQLGQYDGLVGMNQAMAKLFAMEMIFAGKSVFPSKYLISNPNETASYAAGPYPASSGMVNIIKDGTIHETPVSGGFAGSQMVSNLERNMRVEGGISPEMGGECVDELTEILTADGWRAYDQVDVGTEVLTLNHETGMAQWQPILKMNIYPAQEREMYEIEGQRFSALTTTNHRWPVVMAKSNVRKWKTSAELNADHRIPVAAFNADLPTSTRYGDAFVELVAWYWTEGTNGGSAGSIAQSISHNPENCERIRVALHTLYGEPTQKWASLSGSGRGGVGHDGIPRWREKKPNDHNVIDFRLSVHVITDLESVAPNKVVSHSFLRSLTQAQLDLYIKVSMLADNAGDGKLGQKDKARTESFAFACILAGHGVSYGFRSRYESREGFREGIYETHMMQIKKRRFATPVDNCRFGMSVFRKISYDGMVWCPTTPNTSWYARRNGTAYFTGNSQSNVRTGKRGDSIMAAVIDFPVQEAQEILAASLEHENKRGVAIVKNYFGNEKRSFYITAKGSSRGQGHVDYIPNKDFETDNNVVTYPQTGVDANGLVTGGGQRVAMGTMSKRTFMFNDPAIDDPEQEWKQIEEEQIQAAIVAGLTQKLQTGEIPVSDGALIMQMVAKGTPIQDAIVEVQKKAQERQSAQVPAGTAPTQPGLSMPGMGAEQPAIPQQGPSQQNLAQILSSIGTNAKGA
jgi:hypothetical protein